MEAMRPPLLALSPNHVASEGGLGGASPAGSPSPQQPPPSSSFSNGKYADHRAGSLPKEDAPPMCYSPVVASRLGRSSGTQRSFLADVNCSQFLAEGLARECEGEGLFSSVSALKGEGGAISDSMTDTAWQDQLMDGGMDSQRASVLIGSISELYPSAMGASVSHARMPQSVAESASMFDTSLRPSQTPSSNSRQSGYKPTMLPRLTPGSGGNKAGSSMSSLPQDQRPKEAVHDNGSLKIDFDSIAGEAHDISEGFSDAGETGVTPPSRYTVKDSIQFDFGALQADMEGLSLTSHLRASQPVPADQELAELEISKLDVGGVKEDTPPSSAPGHVRPKRYNETMESTEFAAMFAADAAVAANVSMASLQEEESEVAGGADVAASQNMLLLASVAAEGLLELNEEQCPVADEAEPSSPTPVPEETQTDLSSTADVLQPAEGNDDSVHSESLEQGTGQESGLQGQDSNIIEQLLAMALEEGLEAEAPSVGQETRSLGAQETAKAEIEVGHETEAKVEGEFELHPEAGGHGDAEMQRPEDDEDVCSEELADPKAEVTCEIPAAQNAQVPEPGFDAQEEDEKTGVEATPAGQDLSGEPEACATSRDISSHPVQLRTVKLQIDVSESEAEPGPCSISLTTPSEEDLSDDDDEDAFHDASGEDDSQWMTSGAHTNVVYGEDIRASVAVTTMDSALQASNEGVQQLEALAEGDEEDEEEASQTKDAARGGEAEGATDSGAPVEVAVAEGSPRPEAMEGTAAKGKPEVETDEEAEMLQHLLDAIATPAPQKKKEEDVPERQDHTGVVVQDITGAATTTHAESPTELELSPATTEAMSYFSASRDPGSVPPTVKMTDPRSHSVEDEDSEDDDEAFYSPTEKSPAHRANLEGEFESAQGCNKPSGDSNMTVPDEEVSAPKEEPADVDTVCEAEKPEAERADLEDALAGTAAATAIQSENASGVLSAEATGLGDAQEHENLPWPSSAAAREEESKATPPRTESEQEPEPLQANPEHCVEKPMEDRSSEKTPVAASPMPPSWAAQASSLFQMDSSMVLHGVSMALHSESEISPQGDALDFDVPPDVAEHGLQPIAEADAADTGEEFDDSMFQDAAAVAQSLEQRLPPLPADPQHEDAASVHSTHSSLSMGSGEFNLGRVTAVRSSRNSSRLRAPRGSFHFFDKNAPAGQKAETSTRSSLTLSKSIDDLVNVSTPARFKTGPSHRAEDPNVFASYEQKPSGKKALRNKSLFPGGMSCPGPVFGDLLDVDDTLPRSPTSWLFPTHPLADQITKNSDSAGASITAMRSSAINDEDKPLKLYGSTTSLASGSQRRSTSDTARRSATSSASSDSHPRSLSATAEAFKKKQAAAIAATTTRSSQHSPTSGAASRPSSSSSKRYGSHRRSSSTPLRSSDASNTSKATSAPRPAADQHLPNPGDNSGVLFVSTGGPRARSDGAVGNAGSTAQPAASGLQKMFAKGVSKLRMPGSFNSRPALAATASAAPTVTAIASEASANVTTAAVAPAKRTISWPKPPPVFSTPSGPGKRRRKAAPEEKAEIAVLAGDSSCPGTPKASSGNVMVAAAAGQGTPSSMTKIALKKFTGGLKKMLSTPKSKKPKEPTGTDLAAEFDKYDKESPSTLKL